MYAELSGLRTTETSTSAQLQDQEGGLFGCELNNLRYGALQTSNLFEQNGGDGGPQFISRDQNATGVGFLEQAGLGECVGKFYIPPVCGGPPDLDPARYLDAPPPPINERSTPDECVPMMMTDAFEVTFVGNVLELIRRSNLRVKVTFASSVSAIDFKFLAMRLGMDLPGLFLAQEPDPLMQAFETLRLHGRTWKKKRLNFLQNDFERWNVRSPRLLDTDFPREMHKMMWPGLRAAAPQVARWFDDFAVQRSDIDRIFIDLFTDERSYFFSGATRNETQGAKRMADLKGDLPFFEAACSFLKRAENRHMYDKRECPDGYALVRANVTHDECVICPAGTALTHGEFTTPFAPCEPCTGSVYAPLPGSATCSLSCPPGERTSDDGKSCMSAQNFCEENMSFIDGACRCNRGYTRSSPAEVEMEMNKNRGGSSSSAIATKTCTQCPRNYFKSQFGADRCSPCPDGYVSPAGSIECTPCGIGQYLNWAQEEALVPNSTSSSSSSSSGMLQSNLRDSIETCRYCSSGTFEPNSCSVSVINQLLDTTQPWKEIRKSSPCPITQAVGARSADSCLCPRGSFVKVDFVANVVTKNSFLQNQHGLEVGALTRSFFTVKPALLVSGGSSNITVPIAENLRQEMTCAPCDVRAIDCQSFNRRTSGVSTSGGVTTAGSATSSIATGNGKGGDDGIGNDTDDTAGNGARLLLAEYEQQRTRLLSGEHQTGEQALGLGTMKSGYMLTTQRLVEENSREAYKCLTKRACPENFISYHFPEGGGGAGDSIRIRSRDGCPEGAGGIACAECLGGHFYDLTSGTCQKCGADVTSMGSVIFYFCGIVFLVLIFWFGSLPNLPARARLGEAKKKFRPRNKGSGGPGEEEEEDEDSDEEDDLSWSAEEVHCRVWAMKFSVACSLTIGHMTNFWLIQKIARVESEDSDSTSFVEQMLSGPMGYVQIQGIQHLQCLQEQETATSAADAAYWKTILSNGQPLLPFFCLIFNELVARALEGCNMLGVNWRPDAGLGASMLLSLFETFFVFISSNALATGYATFEHPDGDKSLVFQPSILVGDTAAATIRNICIGSTLLWCLGYFLFMLFLFFIVGTGRTGGGESNFFLFRVETLSKIMLPHFARFKDKYNFFFHLDMI